MEFSINPYTRKLNACRRGPSQYGMMQIDEISKSPKSKVEALPNELWLKICEYADFQTSKELRLVNRNLSVFACKKLFAEVYATALSEKLENLCKIANSPNVALHVKKITYVIDRLDSHVLRFQNWKELTAHVSTGPVSDETRARYNRHRELYHEQRALVQGMAEASILVECIPLFTNIQDIEMINWSSIFHNPAFINGPQPILSYLFQDTLISAVDIFDCGHPVERRVGKPHAAIINAFASAGKSMNTLILDDLPWGFWAKAGYPPLFLQVDPSISVAFTNLKLLRLTTCLGTMGSAKNPKSPTCRFIAFLSAAPNLQHLGLTLHPLNTLGVEFFNEDDIDLTAIFKKLIWPKLSTFDINNCKVERDAFIEFKERHKKTMRHVIISRVELLEPDLHIFNNEEQHETDDRDARLVGSRPGESWAFTAKHLAPILNLCHAELSYLDDAYITRRSGAQYAGQGGMRPEEYPRKQAYCHELTKYLIFGGEDDNYDLPVYGKPVLRCPCCACRIEETETSEDDEESQTDEDGEENNSKDSVEESWEDSEDSDK